MLINFRDELRFFAIIDVEIAKTATVDELKQAVEAVFSHLPQKGPGKISWFVLVKILDLLYSKLFLFFHFVSLPVNKSILCGLWKEKLFLPISENATVYC